MVSQKRRRKEINRNNKKLINALLDDKVLSFELASKPRTRQSRSQTVLLAKNYGGDKFSHTVRQLHKSNDFGLNNMVTIPTEGSAKV